MKKIKISALYILLAALTLNSACKKEWLDAKPDKSLVVPEKVADYQALLDNINLMSDYLPTISMVGDGDYYVNDATYNSLGFIQEKSAYLWAPTPEFYGGQSSNDWRSAYLRILQTNVVLDGLLNLQGDATNAEAFNNVKGSALFFRSLDFYNLSQIYCKPYDVATASTDLGLPLRISSNVNISLARSSLQQTYDKPINDLLQALPLLPVTPLFPTRPSKPAAFGLLARVYLSQENYPKALLYADSCLQLKSALMDYNELSLTVSSPIARFNKEVVFHANLASYTSATPGMLEVDPGLYQSYSTNDLRRDIFFRILSGVLTMKASYGGSAFSAVFGGIATDEMYLIRAECYARAGNSGVAMSDLNTLLRNRYRTGTFTDLTAPNAEAALSLIVKERRKELCFRNLRWQDLRRLNKDFRFHITLQRTVNGQTYTLVPNSPRYVLPLDPIETTLGGLQQNPRD
ncbi:RagB/SusD family nutrient uptake outer membrane protein [Flavobacterium zepuense]|uniref:RagB/SusD family nutrient uptake outer membrane protein n=1 Tax=Flavobacterium zepuense TaxID=2593302 RepID=A0A552UTC9_9FLAO|nr:RagB/SusD family nutrient uptake outer membrane protein [Flavobacterium zepuense]TRW21483.1 RagB/SusD family nutrient uptake outer membrane protein [Flavobacterium zepuense]